MSFSGNKRSKPKKKSALIANATKRPMDRRILNRLGVQFLEIVALVLFFVGVGLDNLVVMIVAAVVGWLAVALAYTNYQKAEAKVDLLERRPVVNMPQVALYIAFTLAAALTIMAALTAVL